MNRSIKLYRDPASLSRVLTEEYLMANERIREQMALALIMEIAARRALGGAA